MADSGLIKALFYLGLLIGAALFVYSNIGSDFKDYISGRTSYALSRKSISLEDVPTWTVCFTLRTHQGEWFHSDNQPPKKMRYQEDFTIEVKLLWNRENGTNAVLLENQHVKIPSHLELSLTFLQTTDKSIQCYKISSRLLTDSLNIEKFGLQMTFIFNKENEYEYLNKLSTELKSGAEIPTGMDVMVTSEDNSYGILTGRWFDGIVDRTHLEFRRCHFTPLQTKSCSTYMSHYEFRIDGMDEYLNLKLTCSRQSYYRCLAKRFTQHLKDLKKANRSVEVCSPISLPGDTLPNCKNEKDEQIFGKVLDRLETDQETYCKKTCQVQEYKSMLKRQIQFERNDKFILEYHWEAPQSTRDARSNQLYKKVFTETYVMSGVSLLGNAGGILGTFVGFSFIGIYETLAVVWAKVSGCNKEKRKKMPNTHKS